MISEVVLTNFGPHESATFTFTSGLNVIRGANEKGKSHIFEAVLYAMFGARALDEALTETVTWGKSVNTLQVRLTFDVANIQYIIERSKSGATLTSQAESLIVSGQSEVTEYVGKLLNTNMQMAKMIQFGSQNSFSELVDKESDSLSLIEKLSGLSYLDECAKEIAAKLPSGVTTSLDRQIQDLEQQEPPKLEDVTPLEQAVDRVRAAVVALELDVQKATEAVRATNKGALMKQLADIKAIKSTYNNLDTRIKLTSPVAPYTGETPEIGVEAVERALLFWQNVEMLGGVTVKHKDVESHLRDVEAEIANATANKHGLEVERASLPSFDTNAVCNFCGKGLGSVEEYVRAKESTATRHAELTAKIVEYSSRLVKLAEQQKELRVALRAQQATASVQVSIKGRVEKVDGFLVYSVPDADAPAYKPVEYYRTQKQLNVAYAKHLRDVADRERLIAALKEERDSIVIPEGNEDELLAQIEDIARKEAELSTLDRKLQVANKEFNSAVSARDLTLVMNESATRDWDNSRKVLETIRSVRAEMVRNNNLIRKLRDIRPQVANKVWSTALAAISLMFSTIRGRQSVVTREEGTGFLVDGHKKMSGSTKDSLGVAIRHSLQKIFLPNVDWIILDEPGAGMDNDRESQLLDQLTTCGMRQIILVTHSDLADVRATNLIQL